MSVELHPGDVYTGTGGLQAGGADIWNDASDATWVSLVSTTVNRSAWGWLPPLTEDVTGAVSITFCARIAATTTEPFHVTLPFRGECAFADPGGGSSAPFLDFRFSTEIFTDPSPFNYEHTLTADDYGVMGVPFEEVLGRLAGTYSPTTIGLRAVSFSLTPPTSGARTLTVYEAWLRIDIPELPPPTTDDTPATRLFPRDDALGLGSAPRIFPPPRGGRVVGGYM